MTEPTSLRQTSRADRLSSALNELPLVAILRGVTPSEVVAVAGVLFAAGFRLIEVPLNSPHPFLSIELLRQSLPESVLVGAGTVRQAADVERLASIGADLVVMPHHDAALLKAARGAGLVSIPGVATATEAFAALDEGAHALKLFPAEMVTPAGLKALRAVLPGSVPLLPVGGITPQDIAAWRRAGATGFGLGSALYAPGSSPLVVAERAQLFISQWRASIS